MINITNKDIKTKTRWEKEWDGWMWDKDEITRYKMKLKINH